MNNSNMIFEVVQVLRPRGRSLIYEVPVPPLFGLRGTVAHFSGRKCEEFAVTCCQQKRSAEIKLQ